jgi:hypothetical protein
VTDYSSSFFQKNEKKCEFFFRSRVRKLFEKWSEHFYRDFSFVAIKKIISSFGHFANIDNEDLVVKKEN